MIAAPYRLCQRPKTWDVPCLSLPSSPWAEGTPPSTPVSNHPPTPNDSNTVTDNSKAKKATAIPAILSQLKPGPTPGRSRPKPYTWGRHPCVMPSPMPLPGHPRPSFFWGEHLCALLGTPSPHTMPCAYEGPTLDGQLSVQHYPWVLY